MKNFYIIANAALGSGLSGSDRIFMELARRWASKDVNVHVCVWEEGYEMCQRQKLDNVIYEKWFLNKYKNLSFIVSYFFRILTGIYYSFKIKLPNHTDTYIYAASDFWQDFVPFVILKIRFNKAKFISSFYLTAPNPFKGYRREYEKKFQLPKLRDFIFYLAQMPVKFLIPLISDYIFVTSYPDKKYFVEDKGIDESKVIIITGGVRLDLYKDFKSEEKKYEGIFFGRFHPQKGVIEMIDIWSRVVKKYPRAKLVMIGDGPMMQPVKERIQDLNLESNVDLKGYMIDGPEKMNVMSSAKIALHPAVFDSGGMASAEVMAFKIPAVSFDLEALRTYYPKGMIKVECFDFDRFAEEIIRLLEDKDLYEKTAKEAYECVKENFDWDTRAEQIFNQLKN